MTDYHEALGPTAFPGVPEAEAAPRSPPLKHLPRALNLKIELADVATLAPAARNARTHSKKQIAQISASYRQFGIVSPILLGDDDGIIAGHGRVLAAKALGVTEIPSIRLSHLTSEERRALMLADNRLAELAGWDHELLAIELQSLSECDLDFDLEITGFDGAELDRLLSAATSLLRPWRTIFHRSKTTRSRSWATSGSWESTG